MTALTSGNGASANHFNFHTAVLCATLAGFVACHRLFLTLALGRDAVLLDSFRHQVSLHGFSTTHGETLVIGIATDGIGVTNGNHHFQINALNFGNQLVKNLAALRLEHRLVKIK